MNLKSNRITRHLVLCPLLVFTAIDGTCNAEDLSPVIGVAVTGISSYSHERNVGFGVESTLVLGPFNASLEAIQFVKEPDGRDFVLCAYVGGGIFNLAMAQIGVDPDGIAGRLHGELGLRSLLSGGWGLGFSPASEKTPVLTRNDLALSYSVGVNDAGFFSSLGLGIIF